MGNESFSFEIGKQITFTLPSVNLAGAPEERVMINVIVNGQESNTVPFNVTS